MAGHYVVGWHLAKQKRQNGAWPVEVIDDGCKKDRWTRCRYCDQIGMAVSVEQDQGNDAFLRHDLIDIDEFDSVLLKLLPLRPVSLHSLSFLCRRWGTSVLSETRGSLFKEIM